MTAQPRPIHLIALNNLVASPRNVRKQDRKADIDALAASIADHVSIMAVRCATSFGWMADCVR